MAIDHLTKEKRRPLMEAKDFNLVLIWWGTHWEQVLLRVWQRWGCHRPYNAQPCLCIQREMHQVTPQFQGWCSWCSGKLTNGHPALWLIFQNKCLQHHPLSPPTQFFFPLLFRINHVFINTNTFVCMFWSFVYQPPWLMQQWSWP